MKKKKQVNDKTAEPSMGSETATLEAGSSGFPPKSIEVGCQTGTLRAEMKIETVAISAIKPYDNNPRKNDGAVDAVAKSIQEFGWRAPIVVDADMVVVCGHTRLKAAQKLGLTEVPVHIAEGLTPEQIQAFRIADNKTAEIAEWDMSKLAIELGALLESNSAEISGFTLDEIGEILADEDAPVEGMTDKDAVCEPPVAPVSVPGTLYALGSHRLLCGDSTRADDVSKVMAGEKADLVFTDPPYGMNLDTDYSDRKPSNEISKNKNIKGGKKYDQGKVDDFDPQMIKNIFDCFGYCKEIFLWGADYFSDLLPNRNDGAWIVWDKRSNNTDNIEKDESTDRMYGSCFELCWSKAKHKRDIARIKWAGVFGVEQEFDKRRHHPTQKPVDLSQWFIKRYSTSGDIVVDVFGGSGTTAIACERLGRKARLIELDPKYCDVIRKRWAEYVHGPGCDWESLTPEIKETKNEQTEINA